MHMRLLDNANLLLVQRHQISVHLIKTGHPLPPPLGRSWVLRGCSDVPDAASTPPGPAVHDGRCDGSRPSTPSPSRSVNAGRPPKPTNRPCQKHRSRYGPQKGRCTGDIRQRALHAHWWLSDRSALSRRVRLGGFVETVEFGADLVGVGVVELIEDVQGPPPGVAGCVEVVGGMVGVA